MLPALIPLLAPALSGIIDKIFPDKEKQAEAKAKLIELQNSGEMDKIEKQLSAKVMEAKSKDPWTSRARPSFLYVMYGVIILCFVGGILGIWWSEEVTIAASNIRNLLDSIPESLWWLFGTGYLGYTGARSYDKSLVNKG